MVPAVAIAAAHRANSSQTMKTVGSMVISDYLDGMMKPRDRLGNRENDTSVDDSVYLDDGVTVDGKEVTCPEKKAMKKKSTEKKAAPATPATPAQPAE